MSGTLAISTQRHTDISFRFSLKKYCIEQLIFVLWLLIWMVGFVWCSVHHQHILRKVRNIKELRLSQQSPCLGGDFISMLC